MAMTTRQKQCLLLYLGYDAGPVDGIWGPKSQGATLAFQKDYGLPEDGVFGGEVETKILQAITSCDDWWGEIQYFTREEFACKCGGKYCNGYPAEMQKLLVQLADRARGHFGAPATVVSGLRCRTHNANVGGVANSQHMYGEAVDLQIRGVSAKELLSYLQKQPEVRYTYAINETNVHFDILKGQR